MKKKKKKRLYMPMHHHRKETIIQYRCIARENKNFPFRDATIPFWKYVHFCRKPNGTLSEKTILTWLAIKWNRMRMANFSTSSNCNKSSVMNRSEILFLAL
jgi:hypothetical protein